ncbi:uncharacterized protein [Eurosta solidaginis]|uniref:uncharacterized protein n=1 Tax=Eurosta solidaginis TaxID=178769 RepID=UPI0035312F1A
MRVIRNILSWSERLFNSSLVVMVTAEKPNCLQMLHFKKDQNICHCVYGSNMLSIRMNRVQLIVCLTDSIHIHDIRDMKMLHQIENIAPNELGGNTETVHIFKIDEKAVMMALEAKALQTAKIAGAKQLEKAEKHSYLCTDGAKSETAVVTAATDTTVISTSPSSGSSYCLSKTVSSYILPTQVSNVLAQENISIGKQKQLSEIIYY